MDTSKKELAALKQELATAKHELAEARAYIRRRILAEEPARKTVVGHVTNAYELGRRAVACKHFYWVPGMLLSNGRRVGVWVPGTVCGSSETETPYDAIVLPDLSDPATLGCLLHLVREAWPDEWCEFMVPIFDGFSHWRVGCLQLERLPGTPRVVSLVNRETMEPLPWAYSEAEALVAALEAAP